MTRPSSLVNGGRDRGLLGLHEAAPGTAPENTSSPRRASSIPRSSSPGPRGTCSDVAASGFSRTMSLPLASRHVTTERRETHDGSTNATLLRRDSRAQNTTRQAVMHESSSVLSDLGQAYVKVGKQNYIDIISFINKNPDVRAISGAGFLYEAANALREGDPDYARICIQQVLILRGYNEDRAHRSTSWQAGLLRHAAEEKDLESDIEKVFAALSVRVKETPTPARSSTQPKPSYDKQQAAPPSRLPRHAPESPHEPAQMSAGNQGLQYRAQEYTQGGNTGVFPGHSAEGALNQGAGRNRATTCDSAIDIHSVADSMFSLSALDPSYAIRHSNFFTIGRVLSVVWHSAAGHPRNDGRGIRASALSRSYSGIRRMVIIHQQRGCSWCLGIHTYGGRGLAKSGFIQQDLDEHTIVHMIGQEPQYNPGEPRSKRPPIAIHPANRSQTLHRASRLCFTKIYTIEHNQVVSHVGDIRDPDLRGLQKSFMSYCPNY